MVELTRKAQAMNGKRQRPRVHCPGRAVVAEGSGGKFLHFELGNRWQNGFVEGFPRRFRDEGLHGEQFETLKEARLDIEEYRREYNERSPTAVWAA